MSLIKSYKDLEVWKKSMSLIDGVYKVSANFPKNETFGLISQIRRASCSVPLNIAEGWGRESTKSYIQFLKVARGSLLELETCTLIAHRLDYLTTQDLEDLSIQIETIAKMLNALISSLNKRLTE